MRITQNSMNRTQLAGLNGSLSRLQKTQEELTTGKRLNRPSDSPIDTVSAMRLRGEQRQLEQYGENITDGLSRMSIADSALGTSADLLQRARQLVVQAANGTNSPKERAAIAEELEQVKQGFVQVGNTQYAGRPVFAGTAYNPANNNAFDVTSGAYLGNTEPVYRKITDAPGVAGLMDISVNGADTFGDLLATGGVMDQVVGALRDPAAPPVSGFLAQLDTRMTALTQARSTIGAKVNRLEALQDVNGRQNDASLVALSKVEDTDFMKAAMDLGIQSTAYQAALSASAKIIQPSLVDFLR